MLNFLLTEVVLFLRVFSLCFLVLEEIQAERAFLRWIMLQVVLLFVEQLSWIIPAAVAFGSLGDNTALFDHVRGQKDMGQVSDQISVDSHLNQAGVGREHID